MVTTDCSTTVSVGPLFIETKLKVALASLLVVGVLVGTGSALLGLLAMLVWMAWGLFMYAARMRAVVVSLAVETFLPKSEDEITENEREESRSNWVKATKYDYPMYLFVPAVLGQKLSLRFAGPYAANYYLDVVADQSTMTVDLRSV